jgi:hypothetical protein
LDNPAPPVIASEGGAAEGSKSPQGWWNAAEGKQSRPPRRPGPHKPWSLPGLLRGKAPRNDGWRWAALLNTRWLALIFLACALPTGLCLALLTPMGQVADEPAHIARAAGLLHGQIMGQRAMVPVPGGKTVPFAGTMVNGALVTASMLELPNSRGVRRLTRQQVAAERSIPWSKQRQFDGAPNTVQYFPALYLPGTVGIAAARAIGLSPIQALFAGRIAMLLSYLGLGAAAIAIASFGQGLLFALLCLPMAVSLGASFNQDGQLIAMAGLTGALLTLDPRHHPRLRFAAFPIFALVLCSKPPYGLLMFAFLCPLAASGLLRRVAAVVLFAVPPLIWVVLMMHFAEVPYNIAAYHPGPLWPHPAQIFHATDPKANLHVLLAKPSRFIRLPVQFLILAWRQIVLQSVGRLGWLSIALARWDYHGWYIALAMAVLGVMARESTGSRWRVADAGLVLLLVIASVFAVELAIYLSWDNVGAPVIIGPQGRYYLLFVPFLLLALPRLGARLNTAHPGAACSLEAVLTLPAIIMAVADTGYLPWLLVHRFYLS